MTQKWKNMPPTLLSLDRDSYLYRLEYLVPLIYVASLFIGIAFYMWINNWGFTTAYYYATQVLVGSMYNVPTEPAWYSHVFTLFYFALGTTLLNGAVAAFFNHIVTNTMKSISEERRSALAFLDDQQFSTINKPWSRRLDSLLESIGWFEHQVKYLSVLAVLFLFIIGIVYGLFYEQWDMYHACFCSTSALIANSLCPPICAEGEDTTCSIGLARELFYSSFILVGIPTFTFMMTQLFGVIIERAARASELRSLVRPLNVDEYKYACELVLGPSAAAGDVDIGCFIVMELLRLRKIDEVDLESIKCLFTQVSDGLKRPHEGSTVHLQGLGETTPLVEESVQADVAEYNRVVLPVLQRLSSVESLGRSDDLGRKPASMDVASLYSYGTMHVYERDPSILHQKSYSTGSVVMKNALLNPPSPSKQRRQAPSPTKASGNL